MPIGLTDNERAALAAITIEGSVSKAARKLGMSVQKVSRLRSSAYDKYQNALEIKKVYEEYKQAAPSILEG